MTSNFCVFFFWLPSVGITTLVLYPMLGNGARGFGQPDKHSIDWTTPPTTILMHQVLSSVASNMSLLADNRFLDLSHLEPKPCLFKWLPFSIPPPPSSTIPLAASIIWEQRHRIYGWLISLSHLGSSFLFLFLTHRKLAFMAEQYFSYVFVYVCPLYFFLSSPVSGCLNLFHLLDTVSNNGLNMTDCATISFKSCFQFFELRI